MKKKALRLRSAEKQVLHSIKDRMDTDPGNHITIIELSKCSGLNRQKLTYGFRVLFGQSIYQYLKYRRMMKAYELLSTGEFSVKEVTAAVGYRSQHNFSTAFKQYFKQQPSMLVRAGGE